MHCDPWVWQGPFRHWSGETQWPQRKAIFLYHGDLICNDTNRVLTYHLRLLSCGYFDGHKIDLKKRRWLFCLFLPSHCDLNMLKATPYLCKSYFVFIASACGSLICDLTMVEFNVDDASSVATQEGFIWFFSTWHCLHRWSMLIFFFFLCYSVRRYLFFKII